MTAPKTTAAADTGAQVPLDQLMLAMDIVDTLRHQQQLVDAELDEDRRQRDFVGRVQSIYASQGIEVTEALIADGVRALREDRFTYRPPERKLSVRLAEIYVERGKWARRLVLLALLALAAWAAFALPMHFRRQGQIEGFRRQTLATAQTAEDLLRQADRLAAELQRAAGDDDAATTAQLLANAAAALQSGRQRAEGVHGELTPPPDAARYPEAATEWDLRLKSQRETLTAASSDLGAAGGLLAGVQKLRSLRVRLDAAMQRLRGLDLSPQEQADIDRLQRDVQGAVARGDGGAGERSLVSLEQRIDRVLLARQQQAELRTSLVGLTGALAGVEVEPSAAAELDELGTTAGQAVAGGDWERAREQIARLRELVQLLDQSYELRIVSGPNDRSGVWRHPADRSDARNYYVIVEAIGADGRPVPLRITSEEDQRSRRVSRFGIRVPAAVYEAVKADKLDNGIVDQSLFGSKRRGARKPEYRFEVAGGMITEW